MNNERSIARWVGVFYIIGTAAGILSVVFAGAVIGTPDVLTKVSANVNQAKLGSFFIVIMGISLAFVPIVFYPVAKKYNQVLALGYVVFRGALEPVVYIISAIWLLLVVGSQAYVNAVSVDSTAFQSINQLLSNAGEQIHSMTMIIFSLGALMLYYLFYQSKLIPRWLSGWGFIAAIVYLATGVFALFGPISTVVLLPLALQEMVMALWLIFKGFNSEEDTLTTNGGGL